MRRAGCGGRPLRFLTVLISAAVFASLAPAQDGGIEIFAGETLFESGFRLSVAHLYLQKTELWDGDDRVGDPLDQRLVDQRTVLGINYGLHRRVTLAALVPWRDQALRTGTGAARTTLDSDGLGDAALIVKGRVFTHDWRRGSFNVSLVGGVELPTGATSVKDGGMRLSPGLQPGSGSWDPFVAVAVTASQNRWRFDGQVFRRWNPEGSQDFEAGDQWSVGGSVSYRFIHEQYPGPSHSVRLGVVARHRGRDQANGVRLTNSGSDVVVLRPGLTFHPIPALDIVFNLDLPVWARYRGRQLAQDFRTFVAVGWRF